MDTAEIAGAAAALLDEAAIQKIQAFFESRQTADGGWVGRDEQSDLYYTYFGLCGAVALGGAFDRRRCRDFLEAQVEVSRLGLVDLHCLVRSWRLLGETERASQLAGEFEAFTTPNGGYSMSRGGKAFSVYGSFLVGQSRRELGMGVGGLEGIAPLIDERTAADGGVGDGGARGSATTTVTAAAVLLNRSVGTDHPSIEWLVKRRHSSGGFCATPLTPLPDLLSTAAAVAALNHAGAADDALQPAVSFVQDLWHENGGFCGHIMDEVADCEYSLYALVVLGLAAAES